MLPDEADERENALAMLGLLLGWKEEKRESRFRFIRGSLPPWRNPYVIESTLCTTTGNTDRWEPVNIHREEARSESPPCNKGKKRVGRDKCVLTSVSRYALPNRSSKAQPRLLPENGTLSSDSSSSFTSPLIKVVWVNLNNLASTARHSGSFDHEGRRISSERAISLGADMPGRHQWAQRLKSSP